MSIKKEIGTAKLKAFINNTESLNTNEIFSIVGANV